MNFVKSNYFKQHQDIYVITVTDLLKLFYFYGSSHILNQKGFHTQLFHSLSCLSEKEPLRPWSRKLARTCNSV